MNVKLIVFTRGSGGNFLARVLTLDESTAPMGGGMPTTEERYNRYLYSNVDSKIKKSYNK